jgi:hypothetical protein
LAFGEAKPRQRRDLRFDRAAADGDQDPRRPGGPGREGAHIAVRQIQHLAQRLERTSQAGEQRRQQNDGCLFIDHGRLLGHYDISKQPRAGRPT